MKFLSTFAVYYQTNTRGGVILWGTFPVERLEEKFLSKNLEIKILSLLL